MPTFTAKLTNAGLALYAGAVAAGVPVQLTAMGIGDNNGNVSIPNPEQTALGREVYRNFIGGIEPDPDDPTLKFAELVVPAHEGGWTIREVGIFTIDGTLFAIANFPETYKPLVGDGSSKDLVIRFGIKLSNSAAITLVVNVNIVTATRAWVMSTITAALLIPGGLTNQVLAKDSNADGDFKWVDLGEINVLVDVIEEPQTLAALQTIVNMAVTTTRGLAVYIEGVRIHRGADVDNWLPGAGGTSLTQIVLGKAYPADTAILMVQNEPAGAQRAPLEQLENLADVPNKATARTNLGVYSKAESDASGQPSEIRYFARSTAPTGFLKANGAEVNRIAYAALFAAIGTTFGIGNGTTTFNLPDLRGEFLRGWDDGRGVDAGRTIGSSQADALRAHNHAITAFDTTDLRAFAWNEGNGDHIVSADNAELAYGTLRTSRYATQNSTGTETRPRNVAMLACIKF